MSEYDSILKEKKKYQEQPIVNEIKKFPWFKIDILLLSILLIIGYIIYNNTILTPKLIFINDIKELTSKYENILSPLELSKLNNNYGLVGNINLNDKHYNFEIDRINKQINLILGIDNNSLNYYSINGENYIKLSNNNKYYKLNNNDYLNIISNIKEYFENISEDKFIKKFYLNGTIPIVESNLILNNNDLIEALNPNYYDSTYEVLFTFKNNAISNEIISMKITINNLTTNERAVLNYENGFLTYKDDNLDLRLELEEKENDFTLKIYQNDILFSVLTGIKQGESYQYTYQIIDKIYNISLKISNNNELYSYDITSIIEEDNINNTRNMSISFQYTDPIVNNNITNNITNNIDYSSLTIEEKELYKTNLNNIIEDLRKFINEHQHGIN